MLGRLRANQRLRQLRRGKRRGSLTSDEEQEVNDLEERERLTPRFDPDDPPDRPEGSPEVVKGASYGGYL